MSAGKNKMMKIIHEQPEDSSYDEILKELAFFRMVERGLEDSHQGRVIKDEDMSQRIDQWQK